MLHAILIALALTAIVWTTAPARPAMSATEKRELFAIAAAIGLAGVAIYALVPRGQRPPPWVLLLHLALFISSAAGALHWHRYVLLGEALRCQARLRWVGLSFDMYRNEHDRLPSSWEELIAEGTDPSHLFCPASRGPEGRYILLAREHSEDAESSGFLVIEDPANHGGLGAHALTTAGTVQWLPTRRARAIIDGAVGTP
jgi:hypothetical protein